MVAPFLLPLPKPTPLDLLQHHRGQGHAKLRDRSRAPQHAVLGIGRTPPRLACVTDGEADGALHLGGARVQKGLF